MSKDAINQYDATAANNTDVGGISIDEGMLPSNVNNALREIMSHLKDVDAGTSSLTSPVISGDLTVDTNTLFVDASENAVGIGTSSPNGTLTLRNDSTNTEQLILGNSTNTGGRDWRIGRDNVATGDLIIKSSDATDNNVTTERMRILSGGGLTFNGDTAAANALDDYEEGTWTPTYAGTTTNPTITYHSQTRGNYTKIGNLVIANVEVITDSVSGGSGTLAISGLPFTASSLNRCGTGTIGFVNNFATSNHPAGFLVIANATDVYLYKRSSTDAQAPINTALTTASLSSGSNSAHNQIIGTIVYRTD